MTRTRILVVEDSATVRDLLCSVIAEDPEMDLVGVAGDGREAVALCEQHRPDVVTMDMMLPQMSGLEATEHIMAFCPTPILVVSSSFNRGEVFQMYDALKAGAVDVLEKPTGQEPEGDWERRFLANVKMVSRIRVITHLRARSRLPGSARAAAPVSSLPVTGNPGLARGAAIAGIGASTGGPAAIVEVLRSLPTDLGIPVLFVLHLSQQFGHAFADWLHAQVPWPVDFGRDGELLAAAAGRVIMAPPGRHMLVRDGRIRFDDGPERFSCRPSVDVLFESVARDYGPTAIAALLTGMGRDGAHGMLAIRQAGGRTIAQDEATSVVYGMPREAVLNGGATKILPLGDIGPGLAGFVRTGKPRS